MVASDPDYSSADSAPNTADRKPARHLKLAGRRIPVPASRTVRLTCGVGLVFGGMLGFLPVLGFWMLPLGLLLLSVDLPVVRRWRRRLDVRFGRWRNGRRDAS